MRIVVADCSVDYAGRLTSHLPRGRRVLMLKSDGSVLIHADGGSFKPLNWMSPPATVSSIDVDDELSDQGVREVWRVQHTKSSDMLVISIFEVVSDETFELGSDPGLSKDGVEAHLQELLADQVETLGEGFTLVRREYPTAIGPVDLLVRDGAGQAVAVEVKRRGDIDGVEQLTRYLDLLDRDPHLSPITGIFAAQEIKPQARTLAEDRGIRCVVLDYDELRGTANMDDRLF